MKHSTIFFGGSEQADLVNDETRRKRGDSAARHRDGLAADRTPERPDHGRAAAAATAGRAAHLRVDDMLEAALADRVRAGEQLGRALDAVVDAQARAARQKTVAEVLVVDRDRLDERRRHAVTARATAALLASRRRLD